MAKKAKYFTKKGVGKGLGFVGNTALGRALGPLGLGYTAYNMINDETVGHSDLGTAAGYALDAGLAGAATGAAIGSFIPVVGTAIGAAVGGILGAATAGVTSMYGDDLGITNTNKTQTETLKTVHDRNRKKKQERYKAKFERDHGNLFGMFGDDGDYVTDKATGRVLFVKNTGKGEIYDVKTGKVIIEKYGNYKSWSANKNTKAEEYIKEKSKYIADLGGDKNKIDTKEEIEMLIASISKNQDQVGRMTIEQQNAIIELLSGLVKTHAAGADQTIAAVNSLHKTIATTDKLGAEIQSGNK
jgi:hypothetical protein